MLRTPYPPIIRWAVLCGYALLVALGHGGWHLVTGDRCEVHGHTHAARHTHAAPGKVTICHHGHRHVHPVADPLDQKPQTPQPDHHTPHDSDHCAICAVFAAPQTLTSVVEVCFIEQRFEKYHCVIESLAPSDQTMWPDSRGPPAV